MNDNINFNSHHELLLKVYLLTEHERPLVCIKIIYFLLVLKFQWTGHIEVKLDYLGK